MSAHWEDDFYPEFAGTNGKSRMGAGGPAIPAAGSPLLGRFPADMKEHIAGRRPRGGRERVERSYVNPAWAANVRSLEPHKRGRKLGHKIGRRRGPKGPKVYTIPAQDATKVIENIMPGAAKQVVNGICRRIRRSSRAVADSALKAVKAGTAPAEALRAAAKVVINQALTNIDVPTFKTGVPPGQQQVIKSA